MAPRLRPTANAAPWTLVGLGAAVGVAVALTIASGSGGLAVYHGQDLWALIPAGWKDEGLVAPYGTAAAGWVDLGDVANSITVRANKPAGRPPEARAFARARALGSATKAYVYEISWPGGRSAWEVLYTDHDVHTALFEFNACTPAVAVTVTLDASSSSRLSDMEHTLPQSAEPVCDGAAFTSPDRADVAIPLHLPSAG